MTLDEYKKRKNYLELAINASIGKALEEFKQLGVPVLEVEIYLEHNTPIATGVAEVVSAHAHLRTSL